MILAPVLSLQAVGSRRGAPVDSDAAAFFAAAGITTPREKKAANEWFVGMKADGIYSKMRVFRPLLGTSAASQSYNAINPAANQMTWHGTVVHSNLGIQGDGSTGYGDENYDLTGKNLANFGQSLYLGTIGKNVVHNMGAFTNGGSQAGFTRISNLLCDAGGGSDGSMTIGNQTPGFFTEVRRSLSDAECFQNGASAGTATTPVSAFSINRNLWLLAMNNDAGTFLPTDARVFASLIHDGLTVAEANKLWKRMLSFEITAGRVAQVIAVIDSLTTGFPDTSTGYPAQLAADDFRLAPLVTAVNGSTIAGAVLNASTITDPFYFPDNRATVLVLLGGGNDAENGDSAATIIANITQYCQDRIAAGCGKILAVTWPDRNNATFRATAPAVNAFLRDPAHLGVLWHGVADAAARPELQDATIATYYSDNTHLTPTGYGILKDVIKPKLYALIPTLV